MKQNIQRFQLLFLIIALAISSISLFAVRDVSAAKSALPTCVVWLYDRNCIAGCQPSDPNGCGTAKWSYLCARQVQKMFATGRSAGSGWAPPIYSCTSTSNCSPTCNY